MIIEEEIEKAKDEIIKKHVEEWLKTDNAPEFIINFIKQLEKNCYSLTIISKAEIEQRERLETEKQDVIEMLEKVNNSLEKNGFAGYADVIQDILSYMKGEEK